MGGGLTPPLSQSVSNVVRDLEPPVLSAFAFSILRKLGFIFKWRGRERVEDVALEHLGELAEGRARWPATGYAVAAMTPLRANGRAQR